MAPFITEQAEALRLAGCEVQMFKVEGHGVRGYLSNLRNLIAIIRQFRPDVLHAHYGLCGLLCTLQHKVPVVVTYHGSDINDPNIRLLSRIAMARAKHNIFVSQRIKDKALPHNTLLLSNSNVIPCGINLDDFPVIDRADARRKIGLDLERHYVLFAGAFNNPVKNAPLAKEICDTVGNVELLELKGYSRDEVALLMNAVDCLLMTSLSEGSPQVVKEAMACGCPIVSVDVGDVAWLTEGVEGCHVSSSRDATDMAKTLQATLDHHIRTSGRQRIATLELDNTSIAKRLISIYDHILRR